MCGGKTLSVPILLSNYVPSSTAHVDTVLLAYDF